MTLIVLDTNVLVSGLLREASIPGQIVDLAMDERILREYADVTLRPHLWIPRTRRDDVISKFILDGLWVEAHPLTISVEKILDPKDLPFAEVAVAAKVEALVTGNVKHFTFLTEYSVKVLTPVEFVASLGGGLRPRPNLDRRSPAISRLPTNPA